MLSAVIIWEKALEILKTEMTGVSYKLWVENLTPVKVDDELVLELMLPDTHPAEQDVQASSLENIYRRIIVRAVSRAAGEKMDVRFVPYQSEEEKARCVREEPAVQEERVPSVPVTECPTLMTKYTFDNFVTGESNRFASAAALAVAENPSQAYNPLYIYGGVGLGKTHLIHAIGNYIHETHPDYKILYVTSETFTNDVITAVANNRREELRDKYRTLDVFIVDDIQFIGGKQSTESEFFNVFNHLRDSDKQIIITSDQPPESISLLTQRLKTRFSWGLVSDIKEPDFETRVAILRKHVMEDHLDVNEDVLKIIAERVTGNVRSLEGSLTKIVAYAKFIKKPVTVSLTESMLKDFVNTDGSKRPVTLDTIRQVICDYFSVTVAELCSSRREQRISHPRQIAMYLSRMILNASFPEIGSFYGDRHYSTVMHGYEQIEKKLEVDQKLKDVVDDLTEKINNN